MANARKFIPSEIARLILGYLKEEQCPNTWQTFLVECTHLREYYQLYKEEGEVFEISDKSLKDILNEYCSLKRAVNSQDRANSSQANLPRAPVVNPDSSNPECFKTPRKGNQTSILKHRSAQKIQTQSVTATVRYGQSGMLTPRHNIARSPNTSRTRTPRRLSDVLTTSLNFIDEPCSSSNSNVTNTSVRFCQSDPVLKRPQSHRLVQTELSGSVLLNQSANENERNSHSRLRHSVHLLQRTVDASNNINSNDSIPVREHSDSITDPIPDEHSSTSNQQVELSTKTQSLAVNKSIVYRTSEVTTDESNIIVRTIESALTPQCASDPPPYTRAPGTNSPRLFLSEERSHLQLKTPIKCNKSSAEEFASPRRKGFIPRRRLLTDSPQPKQPILTDIQNVSHEDWAFFEGLLSFPPLAQKIADNINKVKGIEEQTIVCDNFNSSNCPDEIIKDVCAQTVEDPVFDEFIYKITNNKDFFEGIPVQDSINDKSITADNVECSSSIISQEIIIPTTDPKSLNPCEVDSIPSQLAHVSPQVSENIDTIKETAQPSKTNCSGFGDANNVENTELCSSSLDIQNCKSYMDSGKENTVVHTENISNNMETQMDTTSVENNTNELDILAKSFSVIHQSEQSNDNKNCALVDCDEIQIVKEIPPTPSKISTTIQPLQYIVNTNNINQNASLGNFAFSGIGDNKLTFIAPMPANNVYQNISSAGQVFQIPFGLPNTTTFLVPANFSSEPRPVQNNVQYKFLINPATNLGSNTPSNDLILTVPQENPLQNPTTTILTINDSSPAKSISMPSINGISLNSGTAGAENIEACSTINLNVQNQPEVAVNQNKGGESTVSAIESIKSPKQPKKRTRAKKQPLFSASPSKKGKDVIEPDIPVISIPDPSPCKSNSMSAMEILSNITGNVEMQSPILKTLISNAKLLAEKGNRLTSTHVRALDFEGCNSKQNNVDPQENLTAFKSLSSPGSRSSTRLQLKNIKKHLANSCIEIIEPPNTKEEKNCNKNNRKEKVKKKAAECNKSKQSTKTSKATKKTKTVNHSPVQVTSTKTDTVLSAKDSILNAMEKALKVSACETGNLKDPSSESQTGKKRDYTLLVEESFGVIDLSLKSFDNCVVRETEIETELRSSNQNKDFKTNTTHEDKKICDKFFPSSGSDSETETLPLSLLVRKSLINSVTKEPQAELKTSLENNDLHQQISFETDQNLQEKSNSPSLRTVDSKKKKPKTVNEAQLIKEAKVNTSLENNDLHQQISFETDKNLQEKSNSPSLETVDSKKKKPNTVNEAQLIKEAKVNTSLENNDSHQQISFETDQHLQEKGNSPSLKTMDSKKRKPKTVNEAKLIKEAKVNTSLENNDLHQQISFKADQNLQEKSNSSSLKTAGSKKKKPKTVNEAKLIKEAKVNRISVIVNKLLMKTVSPAKEVDKTNLESPLKETSSNSKIYKNCSKSTKTVSSLDTSNKLDVATISPSKDANKTDSPIPVDIIYSASASGKTREILNSLSTAKNFAPQDKISCPPKKRIKPIPIPSPRESSVSSFSPFHVVEHEICLENAYNPNLRKKISPILAKSFGEVCNFSNTKATVQKESNTTPPEAVEMLGEVCNFSNTKATVQNESNTTPPEAVEMLGEVCNFSNTRATVQKESNITLSEAVEMLNGVTNNVTESAESEKSDSQNKGLACNLQLQKASDSRKSSLSGKPKAMAEFYKQALPWREKAIPISPDTISSSSCTLETFLIKKNLTNTFIELSIDNDETLLSPADDSSLKKKKDEATEMTRLLENDSSASVTNNSPSKIKIQNSKKLSESDEETTLSMNNVSPSKNVDESSVIELCDESNNSVFNSSLEIGTSSKDKICESQDKPVPIILRVEESPVQKKSQRKLSESSNCSSVSVYTFSALKRNKMGKRKLSESNSELGCSPLYNDQSPMIESEKCAANKEHLSPNHSPSKKKRKLHDDTLVSFEKDNPSNSFSKKISEEEIDLTLTQNAFETDAPFLSEKEKAFDSEKEAFDSEDDLPDLRSYMDTCPSVPFTGTKKNSDKNNALVLLPRSAPSDNLSGIPNSPVRSFSPRNTGPKSVLSQRTENNPKIPSGVKIPSKWNTSKISSYSTSIENYQQLTKVSKEKNIQDKISPSKKWALRIAGTKSPRKAKNTKNKTKSSTKKRLHSNSPEKAPALIDSPKKKKVLNSPKKVQIHNSKSYDDHHKSEQEYKSKTKTVHRTSLSHRPGNSYKYRDRTAYKTSDYKNNYHSRRNETRYHLDNSSSSYERSSKRAYENPKPAYKLHNLERKSVNREETESIKSRKEHNKGDSSKKFVSTIRDNSISKRTSENNEKTKKKTDKGINLNSNHQKVELVGVSRKQSSEAKIVSLEEGEILDDLDNTTELKYVNKNVGKVSKCPSPVVENIDITVQNSDLRLNELHSTSKETENNEESNDELETRTAEDECELQQAIAFLTNNDLTHDPCEKFSCQTPIHNSDTEKTSPSKELPTKLSKQSAVENKECNLDTMVKGNVCSGNKEKACLPAASVSDDHLNERTSVAKGPKKRTESSTSTVVNVQKSNSTAVDSSIPLVRTDKKDESTSRNNSGLEMSTNSPSVSSTTNEQKKSSRNVDVQELMANIRSIGVNTLLEMLKKETF